MGQGLPVLYSFRRCPYAMRARLAIQSAGFQTEIREVVLRDKPAAMIKVSPKATVPVLVLADGTVIDESLDVMLHVLSVDDPLGWLSPGGATRADLLALVRDCDGAFKKALDRYKYPNRYEDDEGGCDPLYWRDQAMQFLHGLALRLQESGGDWLFGERSSLADYAILPFLRQFANVKRDWFDDYCDEQAASGQVEWALLKTWLEAFLESPLFLSVMPKLPQWHAGDDQTIFPLLLHNHQIY